MKNKFLDLLLWPNLWVAVATALAGAGLLIIALGYPKVGLWFLVPLVIFGPVIIFFIFIPIMILANRQKRNKKD